MASVKKRDGTQIQLRIIQEALVMGAVPLYSSVMGANKALTHSLATNPHTLEEQLAALADLGIVELKKSTIKGKEVIVVVLSASIRQDLANAMPFLSKLITTA